ncbi:hypothetical protein KAX97_14805 [candidate division WOR-3 bacterium]|nr:hypothetical protein [candidate division WOR-3 bacterium]
MEQTILIIITGFIALFTLFLWLITRTMMRQQLLVEVLKEYRSPEMLHAVRRVWEFGETYRFDRDQMKESYKSIYDKDYGKVNFASGIEQIEEEQCTFHNQRRITAQFYAHLAMLYKEKKVPQKTVMRLWSHKDLEIIPKIIIPLEEIAEEMFQGEVSDRKYRKLMLELYRDSLRSSE